MRKLFILLYFLIVSSSIIQSQESKSEWFGYERYDFEYNGIKSIVVCPEKEANGKPWIWRPAFFGAFPSVDTALLKKGFHVVFYDLTHMYGSPSAVDKGTDFYNYLVDKYGFASAVTLEGFSRGGLFVLNWAIQNPEKVACIYLDAPVCNVFSWPGENRKELWADFLKNWNLTENQVEDFKGNPIDNLNILAENKVPIIAVCGDADKTVPYKNNMEIVRNKYVEFGAPVEVIIKKGVDHHPHSLENPEPVVDFICRHQTDYKQFLHITKRGSLTNSFIKFEKERKGRVAFMGGSITEMKGWRTMIQQQLQQRFPYTEFEFVDAGISSTGTTPGAFRLENDVLSKGNIDLIFVEAAVNDNTNGYSSIEQVRGMEGEVRHILMTNPETDIIMLHFIEDTFFKTISEGKIPDVILNHERVANYYLVPSINLSQEIAERMNRGDFTWEDFGGTHPSMFGHRFYAAAINHLFDQMWDSVKENRKVELHSIPENPLDKFSYYNGKFVDIQEAKYNKGWQYVSSWEPEIKANTRKGFVRVPMLYGNKPGGKLKLKFKGKAIGIFCVCGPAAATIEYRVDKSPFKKLDTYTKWSKRLYLPWVYMLEEELNEGEHVLEIRIIRDKNKESVGHECIIRNFVVNE